jgi:RimJ/RimL family protein N-acetyltransferase
VFIQKDNLVIRDATQADAHILGNWWRDGTIMAHAGFPHGLNVSDQEIASSLSTDADDTRRRLIIEADGKPIGEMSYRNKGNRVAEIGIKICDSTMQGQGYGTRLLRMLIDVLLYEQKYEKITLDTNLENTRAQHVYEKIGFRKVSINHNSWKDQLGHPQSSVEYELTETDYVSQSAPHDADRESKANC